MIDRHLPYVPVSRSVNGHPLVGDIELSLDDLVGASLSLTLTEKGYLLEGLEAIDLQAITTKLATIETGATVGATWGSNIYNAPDSLSDINSTEGSKLAGIAAGATVGATWNTDLSGIPIRFADTPSGAGLYLSSSYMGFYNGSAWMTYMDSSGNFFLGGSSGVLQWNGSSLNLLGAVTTGLSGKRVEIRTTDNELEFYEASGSKVRIGSNVKFSLPGIYVTNGLIYVASEVNQGIISEVSGTGGIREAGVFSVNGTGDNRAVHASAINGTSNYSFYGAAGIIWNNGDIDIASGSHYKINGTNLTYSDVGAAASGHNHSGTYLPVSGAGDIYTHNSSEFATSGHNHSGVYAPAANGATWHTSLLGAGLYIAASSGGAVTTQLSYVALDINGTIYELFGRAHT
jgi:hypothetical protein